MVPLGWLWCGFRGERGGVASVERTAYPRFKRLVSDRELAEFFTATAEDVEWARRRARTPGHVFALVVMLKACGRLGYFPKLETVPKPSVEHVRAQLCLPGDVVLCHDAPRTAERDRAWIRERLGLLHEPERARKAAAAAMESAVLVKSHPADLINVALEELVRLGLELPGFSTLDRMAATTVRGWTGRSVRTSSPGCGRARRSE
jgi:hypothetical protein